LAGTHTNTTHNQLVSRTIIAGLKYPIIAASVCGFWVFTRVLYTRGYITGEAKKVSITEVSRESMMY
jgi:glutathione S-transferase